MEKSERQLVDPEYYIRFQRLIERVKRKHLKNDRIKKLNNIWKNLKNN